MSDERDDSSTDSPKQDALATALAHAAIPSRGVHVVTERLKQIVCQKCLHKWFRRNSLQMPKVCPKCKSYNYHLPKIEGRGRPVSRPTEG